MNWLRYGPLRPYIIKSVFSIWPSGKRPEWILNWLYPSDAVVTFK